MFTRSKTLISLFLFSLFFAPHFSLSGQTFSIIKFPQLQKMLEKENDTLYIFNFWATWCAPCVKEFPDFQKAAIKFSDKKIKFFFISLDFKKNHTSTLTPFLNKNKVKNDVYLLDETDYNSWIDKIDPAWSGALPTTLILNNAKRIRTLYPNELTYEELVKIITSLIRE